MARLTREEQFLKYRGTAWHLAGKFSRRYGKPYRELVEVAEYALCLELFGRRGYRKKKGTKKNTWLYTVIYFHLQNVCTRGVNPCPAYPGSMQVTVREWWPEVPFSSLGEEEKMPDPADRPAWLSSLLTEMSEEARALVGIVIEAPAEVAHAIKPSKSERVLKRAREAIREYLIDEMDWTSTQVDNAWAEVQACLGEA